MATKEELLAQAQGLNDQKLSDAIIELLPDDLLENLQDADLYAEKAQTYYRLGEKANCANAVKKALDIDPNQSKANHYQGNLYLESKKYDEAIKAYNKSIQSNAEYSYPYNGLGNVYLNLMQYGEAIKAYNKAIEIDPRDAYSYNDLGIVFDGLKRYDKSIEAYNKAIEIDPAFSHPYYNRASFFEKIKDFAQASKDYQSYLKLTDDENDYYSLNAQAKIVELGKLFDDPLLASIDEVLKRIKELLLFKDRCITHYTGFSVSKALLFNRSPLRLSEGTFLNDTSEGRELFDYLDFHVIKKGFDTIAQPFTQKPFIGSFVNEGKHDDLTLWRMYGKENKEDAKGCAITLDKQKFIENILAKLFPDGRTSSTSTDEEFSFYKVAYTLETGQGPFVIPGSPPSDEDELNTVMKQLKQLVNAFKKEKENDEEKKELKDLRERLNGIAYLFKSAAYQYEHELRLFIKGIGFKKIVDRESVPARVYIELIPIHNIATKITLGPKMEKADEWAAILYYSLANDDPNSETNPLPEILISHLPFK